MSTDWLIGAVAAGLVWCTSLSVGAHDAESLATPITAASPDELWPLEVAVDVVRVVDADPHAPARRPPQRVAVPDGHRVKFSRALSMPRGRHTFEVDVVAHHHPGGTVELEWDLEIREATYRPVSWGAYLRYRLRLGQPLQLLEPSLKIARSDIVSTRGEPFRQVVVIGEETYEIRIFAQSLRG